MWYFWLFGGAFALTVVLVPFIKYLAQRLGAIDLPDGGRKIHTLPVARLGGLAIAGSFLILVVAWFPLTRQLVGLVLGAMIVAAVGAVDDVRRLSPWVKLGWQIVAAAVVLASGVGIAVLSNPVGVAFNLDAVKLTVGRWQIAVWAELLGLVWIVGLTNTINFLDGLDGLAAGVSGIAAFILFLLSIGPRVNQPLTAGLAITLAGAAFGFLVYNFYPAKIFMGDSGAYFLGLVLATLSIFSGGKLATAFLVLGFPILDALWTVVRRLSRRVSPFTADRKHLHHLLLEAGLSQTRAVLVLYFFSVAFGLVAIFGGGREKLIAIAILVALLVGFVGSLVTLIWYRARRAG